MTAANIKQYLLQNRAEFQNNFDSDEDLLSQIDLVATFLFENSKKIKVGDKILLMKTLFSKKMTTADELWDSVKFLEGNFPDKPIDQHIVDKPVNEPVDELQKQIIATFNCFIQDNSLQNATKQSLNMCLRNFLNLKILPSKDTLYMRMGYNNNCMIQDNYLYTRELLCKFLNCQSIIADTIFKDEVPLVDEYHAKNGGKLSSKEVMIPPSKRSSSINFDDIEFILIRTFLKDDKAENDTYRLYKKDALMQRQKTTTAFWTKNGNHTKIEMLKKSAIRNFAKDFIANGGGLLQKIDIAIAQHEEKFGGENV